MILSFACSLCKRLFKGKTLRPLFLSVSEKFVVWAQWHRVNYAIMQWGQCKSSKLSFLLKEQSTSSAHTLSDICSSDEGNSSQCLARRVLSKMDICEINLVNFGCNNCDHARPAVKCIQLQQLKKQIWSCSWLNFSALLFQLLELNTFNCEDYYIRIFTDKVGENRSKQCCIAGCQNEAGIHSVTRTKEIWNNRRMANQPLLL